MARRFQKDKWIRSAGRISSLLIVLNDRQFVRYSRAAVVKDPRVIGIAIQIKMARNDPLHNRL